jgi:Domain of unknown function (DUF4411)
VLYLLDASVLITANNTYYPVDRVPEFWEWIAHHATVGSIKLPLEIYEEVLPGRKNDDPLPAWMKAHRDVLVLNEAPDAGLVQVVVTEGYAPDLTDDEVEEIGRDPFLIAYAMASNDRCVVTVEPSSPKKQRQNRRIPDVCAMFGISSCDPFAVYKTLGFSTAWKTTG